MACRATNELAELIVNNNDIGSGIKSKKLHLHVALLFAQYSVTVSTNTHTHTHTHTHARTLIHYICHYD